MALFKMRCAQVIDGTINIVESKVPKPKFNESLIKVQAFAINRADLLQIEGLYRSPDNTNIPGLEVAGIDYDTGKEVCALVTSGAYAEYVCVDKLQIFAKPKSLNTVEAAALPEALVTCYMNLFKNAEAKSGQTALIHGGSSGIGSLAIQMCKLKGLNVITSVGDLSKSAQCLKLGAESVIDYKGDFDTTLKSKADVILDILGGEHFDKNLRCLKSNGTLCLIAVMAATNANINLATVLMKNLKIIGSTLRSKSPAQKHEIIKLALLEFEKHIEMKELKPVIDSVYKLGDLHFAIDRVRSRSHFGKVVIEF